MNLSLYHRVGGEATVQAAVNIFYDKFTNNPSMARYFGNTSMLHQSQMLENFITIALKSDTDYDRDAMRNAHASSVKKGMSNSHVDFFINTLAESLAELDVPPDYIEEFIEIAESYRADVLGK